MSGAHKDVRFPRLQSALHAEFDDGTGGDLD